MKGLNKLALAAAISAAPFAQAMESIDDAMLGEMTGQSGVSIELSANVAIGSVIYTDTDDAGTFGMNNIVLGGDGGGALDKIKIDIDIDDQTGLMIHLGATNTSDVLTGGADRVDFGLTVGNVNINNTAVLASNISIGGNLGPVDVQIQNDSTINVDAYFEVTSGSMNLDVLGLGISNLTIGDNNAPITTGAYATTLATVQGGAVAQNSATITAAGDTAVNALLATDPLADQTAQDSARAAGELSATTAVEAAAIAGVSNMAYVGMTISTATTGYLSTTTFQPVVVTNALNISIDDMAMDISANLTMGALDGVAADLGSIAINDLNLGGTSLTIYGH